MTIGLASWPSRPASTRVNSGSAAVAVHSLPRVPPRYRFQNAGSLFSRPVSRAVPVSSRARSATGPNGSLRGGSPSSGTAYAQVRYVSGWLVAETARTSPAADQPVTLVLASAQ